MSPGSRAAVRGPTGFKRTEDFRLTHCVLGIHLRKWTWMGRSLSSLRREFKRRVDRFFMPHAFNFIAGWWLILAAFVSGAIIGLRFHREDFLGGYTSFRRRLLRLGHIALAALGMLNVVYGLAPAPTSCTWPVFLPGLLLLGGAIAMPLVCFLSAWREGFRHFFVVPVVLLIAAVLLIILGGRS
jgi:hypothetical protein